MGKIKVGDKVKIVDVDSFWRDAIGDVEEVREDGCCVRFSDKFRPQFFYYKHLELVGELITDIEFENETKDDVRSHNVGASDYAKHNIQPWDIWLEYKLNPWDADIVKRVLRTKEGESRRLDYEKIIHICQERIRQIDLGIN